MVVTVEDSNKGLNYVAAGVGRYNNKQVDARPTILSGCTAQYRYRNQEWRRAACAARWISPPKVSESRTAASLPMTRALRKRSGTPAAMSCDFHSRKCVSNFRGNRAWSARLSGLTGKARGELGDVWTSGWRRLGNPGAWFKFC